MLGKFGIPIFRIKKQAHIFMICFMNETSEILRICKINEYIYDFNHEIIRTII